MITTSRPAMPPTTMRGEVEERRKGLSSGRSRDIRGLDALEMYFFEFGGTNVQNRNSCWKIWKHDWEMFGVVVIVVVL